MFKKLLTECLLLCLMFNVCLAGNIVVAQKEIISLIKSGQSESVKNSLNSFIADYTQNPGLPQALLWIAEEYGYAGENEQERILYQQIIDNFPNTEFAIKAKLGNSSAEIRAFIVSQKYDEAKEAIDKLISDFNNHPDLPDVLYRLARGFEWPNKYKEAKDIFQQIVQKYPASGVANKARLGVYRMTICDSIISKNLQLAQDEYNKMMMDFSNHPDLPDTLYWIAQRYGFAGERQEEKGIYQRIIQNYPNSTVVDRARFSYIGAEVRSLIASQKYDEAKEMLNKLITDFSNQAELPEMLYRVAHGYTWWRKCEEANSIYQRIIQNHPNSSVYDRARLGRAGAEVLSFIALKNYDKAKEFSDKLLSDFKGNPDLWNTFYDIAWGYQWSDNYEEAKSIYEQVQQNSTDNMKEKAKLGVLRISICSLLTSNQSQAAQREIDKMVVDFSGHPDLQGSLYWIAERYEWSKRYEEAKNIYQSIIQNWPSSPAASNAKTGLARANIESLIMSGKYDRVEEAIDRLIADFAGYPNLAESVRTIGNSYYAKAHLTNLAGNVEGGKIFYKKAIGVWEFLIRKFPDSEIIPNAYYSSAVCYAQELGEFQKGIDYLQKIVNNWPDYEYAKQAQLLITEYNNKIENSENEK